MPLTHIINKSLKEGVFPSELKLAKVVPIFKAAATNKITIGYYIYIYIYLWPSAGSAHWSFSGLYTEYTTILQT